MPRMSGMSNSTRRINWTNKPMTRKNFIPFVSILFQKRPIFYFSTIFFVLLLNSCSSTQTQPELDELTLEAPTALETVLISPSAAEQLIATPSPETTSAVTPIPPISTEDIPIAPKAQGADIRIDSWSPDGVWLGYWLAKNEDLTSQSQPVLPGRLNFFNSQTDEICQHENLITNEYTSQIVWQPDGRAAVEIEDGYWIGLPCDEFVNVPISDIVFTEFPDPSLSSNGSHQARTDVRESTDLVLKLTTTILNISTGEIENSVEWEIYQGVGTLGLGGEWLTDNLFLIYETLEQGPLLIQVGGAAIQIAPELFGVPGVVNADPNNWVGLEAFTFADKDKNTYHLLLAGTGIEAEFPQVRLYHSETGEVEELPYTHLWGSGFSPDGRWILLDSRPDRDGYESYTLWVRSIDPPGGDLHLIAEGFSWINWSPDWKKVAFGWNGSVSVSTFPEGEEISTWDTREYPHNYIIWSSTGDFIAVAGNIPGEFDSALFVVPIP